MLNFVVDYILFCQPLFKQDYFQTCKLLYIVCNSLLFGKKTRIERVISLSTNHNHKLLALNDPILKIPCAVRM